MVVEVKFCGLTRRPDAEQAARLGAAYAGVVFAGGPRLVSVDRAVEIFAGVPAAVRRVGVFGRARPEEVAAAAAAAGLDVVQLHGDPTPSSVDDVRRRFDGEVWGVVRIEESLPADFDELAAASDAVVLDARVAGALGGTGVVLDWAAVARALEGRRPSRLALAGGLTPENVGRAAAVLAPDIVDVSSGVERAPGIKDHARMRAFVGALGAPGVE